MARKYRKSFQEQPVTESEEIVSEKKEIKTDVVEIIPEQEEPMIEPVVEEPKVVITIQEEDVKDLDEKFGIDAEEEVEAIIDTFPIKPEEKMVVNVKPMRPLSSLSPDELKRFQRTGILPK